MVTFAQAQERAEEWINGELPAYQHREVRVREFDLGFVVWAEDREGGVRSGGGTQRLVIARDGGEATLWPGLPVGEVIRRYEEEYGGSADAPPPAAPEKPQRIDLHQTSFLITPPEWLQEAANRRSGDTAHEDAPPEDAAPDPGPEDAAPEDAPRDAEPGDAAPGDAEPRDVGPGDAEPRDAEPEDAPPAVASGAASADGAWPTPSRGTAAGPDDGSVPLPVTVLESPVTPGAGAVGAELPTALMEGGSQLPPTAVEGAMRPGPSPVSVAPPQGATPPPVPPVSAASTPPPGPGTGAADIADAATAKAPPPRRPGVPAAPPPPGPPGPPPGPPAPPGGTGAGYVPTQLVSQVGPGHTPPPGPPVPPPAAPDPGDHEARRLAGRTTLG
ncbi:hypothetical protein ACFW15_27115, partial [Streptomyces sp. NPDC058953]